MMKSSYGRLWLLALYHNMLKWKHIVQWINIERTSEQESAAWWRTEELNCSLSCTTWRLHNINNFQQNEHRFIGITNTVILVYSGHLWTSLKCPDFLGQFTCKWVLYDHHQLQVSWLWRYPYFQMSWLTGFTADGSSHANGD